MMWFVVKPQSVDAEVIGLLCITCNWMQTVTKLLKFQRELRQTDKLSSAEILLLLSRLATCHRYDFYSNCELVIGGFGAPSPVL